MCCLLARIKPVNQARHSRPFAALVYPCRRMNKPPTKVLAKTLRDPHVNNMRHGTNLAPQWPSENYSAGFVLMEKMETAIAMWRRRTSHGARDEPSKGVRCRSNGPPTKVRCSFPSWRFSNIQTVLNINSLFASTPLKHSSEAAPTERDSPPQVCNPTMCCQK
jgi:hypothetical protein